MTPDEIIAGLRGVVRAGGPVVMAGVGSGLTAAGAAAGGAHLLAAYSTAVYRCRGLPSVLSFLPYDDANALAFAVAGDVVEQARGRPVILGVGAHDPRRPLESLLDRVKEIGAAGVMNEPFVGMYSPEIRADLEEAGLGFSRELALIERAAARGLIGFGWGFSPAESQALARSGARLIGAMLGPSRSDGSALDAALAIANSIAEGALAANPEIMVLAHGGPLTSPEVVRKFLVRSRCHGYATGSSAERSPVIQSVAQTIRDFARPLPEKSRGTEP
jgi:predicted TIM-barrel enzyme